MNNFSIVWNWTTTIGDLDPRSDFMDTIPYCFIGIGVVGIFLNAITLIKLKTARRHSFATRLSLQLLSAMAVADILSLIALLFMVTVYYFHLPAVVMTVLCKMDVFCIHAASAFSIWCWLLQSIVRYAAIYFPYLHLKHADNMTKLVMAVAGAVSLLESWILIVVQYNSDDGICKEELYPQFNRHLHLFEILWSYFMPLILISVIDAHIIFCGSSLKFVTFGETDGRIGGAGGMNMSTSEAHSRSSDGRNRHNLTFLRRCVVIALADLIMNLPSYTLRLLMILVGTDLSEMFTQGDMNMFEAVAQLFYFGQFSCNAMYLAFVIYGTPPERTDEHRIADD